MKYIKNKYINTTWIVRTYDVWGNKKDGWEVNNIYLTKTVGLRLRVLKYNVGLPSEFEFATPSDKQIRVVLDIKPRTKLDIDGDDLVLYVSHESSGYPFGELVCTSHDSLFPIKLKVKNNG